MFGSGNGNDDSPERPSGPPAGMPKPEAPPFRVFEVVVLSGVDLVPVTHTVHAHSIDFTTAGGVFFTSAEVQWTDDQGWVLIKRYSRGFGSYEEFTEVTPAAVAPSRIVH